MTRYAIGLGSNVGDRLGHLIEGCRALEESLAPIEVSSIYETEPVGGPEQDPFLNAVAVVDTALGPEQVLDVLHRIEADQGRERTIHWGPRTLDLDIVAGPAFSSDRLIIPHPRAVEREFVLRPLVELWPDALVAGDVTASEALGAVGRQGVDRLVSDWRPPVSRSKAKIFLGIQFALFFLIAVTMVIDGAWPPENWLRSGIGFALGLGGIGWALWASRTLGTALTASPLPRPGSNLVTTGPYAHVRHPIYGGLVLLWIGAAMVAGSLIAFLAALLAIPFLLTKASYEEGHLRIRHPGYRSYMTSVPRRLLPFLL